MMATVPETKLSSMKEYLTGRNTCEILFYYGSLSIAGVRKS
jgi:hypothetical protein